MNNFKYYIFSLMFVITACSTVNVRIEQPTTIADEQIILEPVAAEMSASLEIEGTTDDSEVWVRDIVTPFILFDSNEVRIEMLGEATNTRDYFVVNQDKGLRLRNDWRAVWLADSEGEVRVDMDVYLQYPFEENYQWLQDASIDPVWGGYGEHQEALLDSTLYFTGVGRYGLRVAIAIETWNNISQVSTSENYFHEIELIVLNEYDDAADIIDLSTPAFDDLEWDKVYFAWGAWRWGPCAISEDGNSEFNQQMNSACEAYEADNWEDAILAIEAALETTENDYFRNRVSQQIGILAAALEDWEKAVDCFEAGLEYAINSTNAREVAFALHNLGIAYIETGRWDEGEPLLWQAIDLYDQIEEYQAVMLVWAQFGFYWESEGTFDWVLPLMYEYELPQSAIVDELAAELFEPSEGAAQEIENDIRD